MRFKGADRYSYYNVGIQSEYLILFPNRTQVSAVCIP